MRCNLALIGPEAGFARGEAQTREGPAGYRPGPAGVGLGLGRTVPRGAAARPPTPAPPGASGARFAVWPPLYGSGTWLGSTPV